MNKILLENNEAQPVNMVNVDGKYVNAQVARPQSAATPSMIILRRREGAANAWDIAQVSGPWKGLSLPEGKTDEDITTTNPDGSQTAHYIKSTIPGFDKDRTDALEWALFLQIALNNNQSLDWWPNIIKA